MASVTDIRDGLAARLTTIPGLRVTAWAPDRISAPAASVEPTGITFDESFGRGHDELRFTVRLYASRADDRSGQARLDAYLTGAGPTSVKAAIEADRSLGGSAITCRVVEVVNYGVYDVADVPHFGAEFNVIVWARGV